MQSTGQTSTQDLSLTLMQASVITYGMAGSRADVSGREGRGGSAAKDTGVVTASTSGHAPPAASPDARSLSPGAGPGGMVVARLPHIAATRRPRSSGDLMLRHAPASGAPSARRHAFTAAATAAATAAGLLAALAAPLATASAQYFGRNKVNYETFDFRVIRTPTFDVHYYPAESLATSDMARASERWYARLRPFLRHQFNERKSIIFFADQPDFQQNNVTQIESEGTGGVTEGARQRVVMPHTGSYFDTHHVLGHELVHVFQYDIAQNMPAGGGGAMGLNALPLWLVEGMAEYLSLGRDDSNTAMWLRDAARRNDIPTIKQLTTDPRYFPYRYGQALW